MAGRRIGIGVDTSAGALRIATANAVTAGVAERAEFVHGGWDAAEGTFDLVLCNPPYVATGEVLPRDVVEWEPASALFAGADGLDDYRALAPLLGAYLAAGGVACVEIGSTQAQAVTALFAAQGLVVDAAPRSRGVAALSRRHQIALGAAGVCR